MSSFDLLGLGIKDPLDCDPANFDPIQYINHRFPTEASLDDLDTFVVGIESQISALDEEISRAVQAQSAAGQQASQDISEAQKSIQELFEKVNDIKTKASQSERMVQEICSDIKKLDFGKNHLQSSITSLKRMQMLITAVNQLESLASECNYKDAANLIDAVRQLMVHFERYTNIPMVADIKSRIDSIQNELKRHVHKAFREIGQLVDSVADAEIMASNLPGNMKHLSDACLIVDALGPAFRKDVIEEVVQLQLVPYEKLFGPGKEHFSLDQVDRRWAWFKRLVKNVEAKFSNICPSHWRLSLRLCFDFMERTKVHIVTLLNSVYGNSDVSQLLKALQTTLRFEQEMAIKYNARDREKEKQERTAAKTTTSSITSSSSIERSAVEKLRDAAVVMYVPTDHSKQATTDDDEIFLDMAYAAIAGGISGLFDKFLGSYVTLEKQNLEDMLKKLSEEEDTTRGGDESSSAQGSNVYGSSMSMFVFIKNSIKRCTALTTGQTFLSLTKEFKGCMQQYSEQLKSRLPTAQSSFRVPAGGDVSICHLINTGEYCADVVPQLEHMIKAKMDAPYKDRVDMTSEVDAFQDLIALGIKVLVGITLERMDPAFKAMAQTNWSNIIQVAEESPYCLQLNAVLVDMIPRIRESLSKSYQLNFYSKLATDILNRYQETILRQKRISEMATQQLLLDTYNLKTLLLQLHCLGMPAESGASGNQRPAASSMYTKLVNTKSGHIETILKLVGTPEELLKERFQIMWPTAQASDLQTLMALKGMKRQDQQSFLESFGLSGLGSGLGSVSAHTANAMQSMSSAVAPTTASLSAASSAISSSARSVASMKWK